MTAASDVARIAAPRVSPSAQRRRPTSHTLPPELLADAARRLRWVAVIGARAGVLGLFGRAARDSKAFSSASNCR